MSIDKFIVLLYYYLSLRESISTCYEHLVESFYIDHSTYAIITLNELQ